MSFLEHLEEMRWAILHSLAAAALGAVAVWNLSGPVLDFLVRDVGVLYFATLTEGFTTRLWASLVLGLVVTLPYIAWRMWRFILPGLFPRERRFILPLSVSSLLLFYLGIAFAFFAVKPLVVRFLLGFGDREKLVPIITISSYFGFVAKLCLGFGLVFQLPLVVCVLSLAGVIDPNALGRQWRVIVVAVFTVSAIVTPPDVASQILMAVPLLALFMGSIHLSRFLVRRRGAAATADASGASEGTPR
jgi:sec-independent protein translocase protein TatC